MNKNELTVAFRKINKEDVRQKIPSVSMGLLGITSLYLTCRSTFNYISLLIGQFKKNEPQLFIFGEPKHPGWIGFILSLILLILGWLFSTKYKRYQTLFWRQIWFWNMFIGVLTYYLWIATSAVYNTFVPYLSDRISKMTVHNIWYDVAVGNTQTMLTVMVFVPTIATGMILMWLVGQYSQYSAEINEAFHEFEFKNSRLQKLFSLEQKEYWPDVVLGPDSESKELIIQPGRDRTLNNIIIGSIGTGKTAALVLPILNQDLHWMTHFINDYPDIYQKADFETEEVQGMYLNGISVIEPSNDLCQKAYQLVLAHGIPKESVFYIDPTNPNTPSINPMQGPVDKVAEAFSMVIEGLAEGGSSANFFFQQSERNHLKHYIYLLKLHDPNQEVTFDMLLQMYDNPQLVHKMHEKLKETIPKKYQEFEDRDERNHWAIVKQIDEWFNMNHVPKTNKSGSPEQVTHGEFRGEQIFYDAKAEYVQGLRNILNDIGANPLIRRVLFGKSDFSFDRHLKMGGVLLVNTAKGELSGLSNVLGKLILLSLQNAVFRREPNISNFHHILTDEFPDYIYRPFKEFPAQSRKYKVIVTVVAQTIAQLADKYGETYMHTLLGTLRHKMVYGDIPDYDAQLFSKIFGEQEHYEEGISEQSVSPLQDNPSSRKGNSYTKTKEAILSPSDIIYQKAFQCAIKIVANNKPIPVRQIDANFVPRDEFKTAKVTVDEERAKVWLENRQNINTITPPVTEIEPDEQEDISVDLSKEPQPNEQVTKADEGQMAKREDPLTIHPFDKQPIEYPVNASENNNQKVAEPKPELEKKLEEPELERVDFAAMLNEQNEVSSKKIENKTTAKSSELGEKQEELINEIENELKSVEVSKKRPDLSIFVRDFEGE